MVMDGNRQISADAGTGIGASNNTFEVLAVARGLSWLEREALTAASVIWTGSTHLAEGFDGWRHIWRGNCWKRVRGNSHERRRAIPDVTLWQELDALLERNPQVRTQLCKGHAGVAGNEVADAAAKLAVGCSVPRIDGSSKDESSGGNSCLAPSL